MTSSAQRAEASSGVNGAVDIELTPWGDCRSNLGDVDMRRVMLLESKSVVVGEGKDERRVGVETKAATIETPADDPRATTYIQDIGWDVTEVAHKDVDLIVKLAVLDGELLIYWRESYINKIYMQGLYAIDGTSMTPRCQGKGGMEMMR